jgi:exosortase A
VNIGNGMTPFQTKNTAWLLGLSLLMIMAYGQSWLSMAAIWRRSDTFMHGFLVAPAALYMVWLHREDYRGLTLRPAYTALAAMTVIGFVWLCACLVHTLVVEQLAAVGMWIALFVAVMGWRALQRLAFPIAFLLLMVPVGDDLVPMLMQFTAKFVVWLLQVLHFTVYQQGLSFQLASGQWSVVEACSGIRYLLATITLGAIFAFLNYRSWRKRLIFMLCSAVVPVFANGVRAFLIVMIGHYSNMQLATGVDHIIYGWLFFGLVIWILFSFGARWRDPLSAQTQIMPEIENQRAPGTVFLAVLTTLMLIWPIAGRWLENKQLVATASGDAIMRNWPAPWQLVLEPGWGWWPRFRDTDFEQTRYWQNNNDIVGVYAAGFANDAKQGELVNWQHRLILSSDHRWRMVAEQSQSLQQTSVNASVIADAQLELLVWRWYRIGDRMTDNAYQAKWLQLIKRLRGDAAPELLMLVFTPINRGDQVAAQMQLSRAIQYCCGMTTLQ